MVAICDLEIYVPSQYSLIVFIADEMSHVVYCLRVPDLSVDSLTILFVINRSILALLFLKLDSVSMMLLLVRPYMT